MHGSGLNRLQHKLNLQILNIELFHTLNAVHDSAWFLRPNRCHPGTGFSWSPPWCKQQYLEVCS